MNEPDEELVKFYNDAYVLSYIIRYSNVIRIKNESVAEHCFYVALLVLKLHDEYDFKLEKALSMALVHDILEAEVNDITHYTKQKYPMIKWAVDKAEKNAAQRLTGRVRESVDCLHENSVEAKIVEYADVIQCSQYAQHECKLGNDGYMGEVYKSSLARAEQLKENLSEYRRL